MNIFPSSVPVYTNDSYIGKRFKVPVDTKMFCLNIQHKVILDFNPMEIEITGLDNGGQYFCKEIKFWGDKTEPEVVLTQFYGDVPICYIINHHDILKSEEINKI